MIPRPGAIYWGDLNDGYGKRRVVVVSHEAFNRGNWVTVLPITSQRFEERSQLPNCVVIRAGTHGMTEDCVAQGERIITMLQEDLLVHEGLIGRLDDEEMRDVVLAIGYAIGAHCEPTE